MRRCFVFGLNLLAERPTSVPYLCESEGRCFFKMERVSVYIDGANFLYGIRSIQKGYSDFHFDFEKYINKIIGDVDLVKVYYYNASLKYNLNPELFKDQQHFFNRLTKIDKFEVILCKRQRRVSPDGEEHFTIKGDDIHLAIDMLKDVYENRYDLAILISGDGDFAPLVKAVRYKDKKVKVYHFRNNISTELLKTCDDHVVISKKTVNKYFYRGPDKMTIGDMFLKEKSKKKVRK